MSLDDKETNEPMELHPMNAADRRVIHKLAAENGMTSESLGEGRDRHIVLKVEGETKPAETDKED